MRASTLAVGAAGLLLLAAPAWYGYHQLKPSRMKFGGISLGMTVDEYRASNLAYPIEIAGIVGAPQATFRNGKLSAFQWQFATDKYERVRGELKEQFPQMQCTQPPDPGGKPSGREVCSVDGKLILSKGLGNGWTSLVWLKG